MSMTDVLHFPARPDAPIACDMSTAIDTPQERLAEYAGVIARSGVVAVSFRAQPGVREAVEELARREAACCPFLDLRVESSDAEITFTIRMPV